MQRLSDEGETLFGESGMPLFRFNITLQHPVIVATQEGFITSWWKGIGSNCLGLMSQLIDSQGDLITDPVDLLFAKSGGINRFKLISTDENEFAAGWIDAWFPIYSPVLSIRTFSVDAGNLVALNEDGTIITAPEGYFLGDYELVAAGNGEVIVLYTIIDDENVHLMVRKMNGDGSFNWRGEGYLLASNSIDISNISAVSDENGGAFIIWTSCLEPDYYQRPFCQYVSSEGELLWGDEGIMLGNEGVDCLDATICTDGEGGAVFLWREVEYNDVDNTTVLAMNRISAAGEKLWSEDGSFFIPGFYNCTDLHMMKHPGGYFLAWTHSIRDDQWNQYFDIRAQMISEDGVELWNPEGVALCHGDQYRGSVDAAIDSNGLIWVSWQDNRGEQGFNNPQIYCTKIDPEHIVAREPSVILNKNVTDETLGQYENRLIPDTRGGMWFVWSEYNGLGLRNIRTIHLDADGDRYEGWDANGMDVCNEVFDQSQPQCIPIKNAEHGIVAAWQDYRSSVNDEGGNISNLYCQHIDDGYGLGIKPSDLTNPVDFEITGCYPNPFNSMAALKYRLGISSRLGVQVFDMTGRQVFGRELAKVSPGTHSLTLNAEGWSSGEYIARLRSDNGEISRRIILVK